MRNGFEEFNKLKICENRKGKREFHSRKKYKRQERILFKAKLKKKKNPQMETFWPYLFISLFLDFLVVRIGFYNPSSETQ